MSTLPAPITLEAVFLDELHGLVDPERLGAPPGPGVAQAIAALQSDANLAVTGELSAQDLATLRARHGPDLFVAGIEMAKSQLRAAGYEVDLVDGEFDAQMAAALMALSHDSGRAPDPTLSLSNIGLLSSEVRARACTSSVSAVSFRILDAQALVDHAERLFPPVSVVILNTSVITGDRDLDERIEERASSRGYRLRPTATDLLSITDNITLDPSAAADWARLQQAAESEGITMFAASGYRSPELQLTLFQDALSAVVGPNPLSSEVTDEDLDQVLDSHAPPGFSKHQTGLAIDIAAQTGSLADFASTTGFEWLSINNYENARRFGFVPSYPAGVEGLGPQPEPWEWLWVGTAALYRCPPAQ